MPVPGSEGKAVLDKPLMHMPKPCSTAPSFAESRNPTCEDSKQPELVHVHAGAV